MQNVILELTRIQKEILEIASPQAQVRKIVDSISAVVGTDVCTLYLMDENRDMVLIVSHGLRDTGPIKIPAGLGLVGLVAQSRHSINLARAAAHPRFYYVAGTEEERFQSFCGVPLVRYGKVIGVLVVQSRDANALSPENEAFLVTLSSQLALLVNEIPANGYGALSGNVRIPGVKGSSGVGIGHVQLCDGGELFAVPDSPCTDTAEDIRQWHQLLHTVRLEIEAEQQALGSIISDSIAGIFESYEKLLADPALITRVEAEILAGNWLPGALRKGIQFFSELFMAMEDPYLHARHEDIHHLGNKLYKAFLGMDHAHAQLPEHTGEGLILVGTQVSISDIASLPPGQIAGIVCFEGSSMSHTAVLANALGIPAVMGTGRLKGIHNEERLIVDGNIGQVIRHPNDMLCAEFRQIIDQEKEFQNQLAELRDEAAITQDHIEISLFTNSGLLADLTPGLKNGAQGIGLYRTEIPFMVRDSFPSEEEQVQVYHHVFDVYQDKPVYMRTLDIGGDKQLPYFPITNEDNPALGWRGIRFSLDNIQLLMTQVRAMVRAAQDRHKLNILLPMVSSTSELDTFTELLAEACEQLRIEGYLIHKPRVGAMIEVPAAISQIPFWASRLDFISIGSNDLSQYLLALDRNNARVAGRYDHIHPAVIHEIFRIVNSARQYQLPLSLCGEMASDPMAVILLLGMGIRTLSMSAVKLPRIKWLIRSLSLGQAEAILQRALSLDNVEAIRSLLAIELKQLNADLIK
ncbi:MAG: phosphoenolpyruvate--protein phosphotransferase [Pseudomonadales bacterium]|nr:phosphoenolpyruvate--protein phosphotransferase [Pseudomonadales bacterium]